MFGQTTIPHQPDGATAANMDADLPSWDLNDLYPGMESGELAKDLDRMEAAAQQFHEEFKGKIAGLDGAALAHAIEAYEDIDETLSRIMSFAHLTYAGDMTDPEIGRFYQSMQERVTTISTPLLFFTLEINKIEEDAMDAKLKDPALQGYASWLRDIRVFRPHQLDDEIERMLHERHVVGRSAWTRLFDETVAGLRFPFRGEELTSSEILNLMSDPDADKRKDAAKSVGQVFGDNIRVFTLITNTLAKEKQIDDGWRSYATPVSARNLGNYVEDEVVEALSSAVTAAYPKLSHRYYAMKAKWLGDEKLAYWDRNAPLPDDVDREITWPEATKIVLDAYGQFSPELADVGRKFFDNAWIDVPPRPGKSPGAFAHPTVPSAHPYLLLNYHGKVRDVMTLAHELGHGVHQVLAGSQGHLQASTPLTLAETASVFGEMLTFRSLLDAETDPKAKRILLAGKVEDMLNTVVRQIAFFEFEKRLHNARQKQELTAEEIGKIWMDVQTESLGPALQFEDEYQHFWAYIPHFIHSPFYVYAYAFGDCLVNALYAVYQDADEGFAERYMDMLRAGGTKRHKELLAPFGLDATDPAFWNKGLDIIASMIDELEAVA
ncbi:MAG: M3 family oligoendopeptidase [Alphaproteobacteria bacterium]|nr:M3 family oligoendopeptidase [Alphaproteobacteria bacterium SS10]